MQAEAAAKAAHHAVNQLAATGQRQICLKEVISQLASGEIQCLEADAVEVFYKTYERTFGRGKTPPKHKEPSIEQLTGLQHSLKHHNCYVDFAVFGPFHLRLLRKQKLSGTIIAKDGTTRILELLGPPTFDTWEACFDVYSTAMLMLAACDLGSLTDYVDLQRRMHCRYGPMCWHLQYQAEARMRLE